MADSPFMQTPCGIGVDLVRIDRIAEHLEDERFLNRLFTPGELKDAGNGPQRAARLAVRWAAKEALAKALGCGFGDALTWNDVEVVRGENGAPSLRLSERAGLRYGNPNTFVSLSHDGEYAIAMVWLSPSTEEPTT
jgi:holo-[acyl-carrier protein] synthase